MTGCAGPLCPDSHSIGKDKARAGIKGDDDDDFYCPSDSWSQSLFLVPGSLCCTLLRRPYLAMGPKAVLQRLGLLWQQEGIWRLFK
jgi:hypothetical protein